MDWLLIYYSRDGQQHLDTLSAHITKFNELVMQGQLYCSNGTIIRGNIINDVC